jgi:hypothetical protein
MTPNSKIPRNGKNQIDIAQTKANPEPASRVRKIKQTPAQEEVHKATHKRPEQVLILPGPLIHNTEVTQVPQEQVEHLAQAVPHEPIVQEPVARQEPVAPRERVVLLAAGRAKALPLRRMTTENSRDDLLLFCLTTIRGADAASLIFLRMKTTASICWKLP